MCRSIGYNSLKSLFTEGGSEAAIVHRVYGTKYEKEKVCLLVIVCCGRSMNIIIIFLKAKGRFIQLLQGRRYAQETVYIFNVAKKKNLAAIHKTNTPQRYFDVYVYD